MKHLFASLAFRLIALYGALFTGLAFLLLGTYYWMTIHTPYRNIRNRVQAETTRLVELYESNGTVALQRALEARLTMGGVRRPFHALVAPGGRVVTTNLLTWPAAPESIWLRLDADSHQDGEIQDIEPLLRDHVFADGTRLLVGRDIEDIDELEEKLLSVALGVVATGLALGLLGGWLMSRETARRIGAVTRTARQVMDGDLSGRIALSGRSDDFDALGATLNEMLGRTEKLFDSVRRVSDSVAHELRTPLARLRATLETMKAGQRNIASAQLDELLADVAALEKTFDAVLRIARIESIRAHQDPAMVDLTTVIRDAAELYAPEADDREQQMEVSLPADLAIHGDRDLLFQSVCNLIDNAVKYTPPRGQIRVSASRSEGLVEIVIRDNGPGIPAPHQPHVVERFYRVPATAAAPGAGLGLSLVAAVAARHHSRLEFRDASPGLIVSWKFPASS